MPSPVEQRVILLANVDVRLNPYIELLSRTLKREGLAPQFSRKVNAIWGSKTLRTAVLHLHWAETLYCIRASSSWRSKWIGKLLCNRVVAPARSLCRLSFGLLTIAVCKLRGAWIVYTVHNLEPHSDEASDRLLHRIATWSAVKLANRVHVHSEATREVIKADYGREDGVVVIPLGNFMDHYPRGISRREARDTLRIAPDLIVFLFLGLIRPYKGIEELVPAFLDLGTNLANKRLLIVGAVQDKKFQARIASIMASQPSIKLVADYVTDEKLQVFLAACDLAVFPYRTATTSAAAVLALSFGRPVIGPVSPAFSHLVTEQTGVLYDPGVPGALTAALRTGAERTWDEQAILEFARQFDWQRLGPSLCALYDRASERDKGPAPEHGRDS
jgi:beta-1,4-mannosyltransferase